MQNRSSLIFPIACLFLVAALVFQAFVKTDKTIAKASEANSEDAFAIALNPTRDYLIIVNEDHKYEFGGDYDKSLQEDLIYATDCFGIPTPIEHATSLAFGMLRTKLHTLGIDIELYSSYRTEADQQWVLDTYGSDEEWAANNTVLAPGFSEHHTGLMLSFLVWWPDDSKNGTEDWFQETAEFHAKHPELDTIRENLADFGFIERYPADKVQITGVKYEPYEIRFVGSSEVAHEIMDNGLCLEEYLEEQE